MQNKRHLIQIVVACVIIGVIAYIETSKPSVPIQVSQDIAVGIPNQTQKQTQNGVAATATTTRTTTTTTPTAAATIDRIAPKIAKYAKAKELADPQGFINSPNGDNGKVAGGAPFTLSQFVGKKVILLDFWTYSCINCERTIPYLNALYQKYKDQGLVIVGVHTPEFEFEKDYSNVTAAVAQFGIKYPVVLDSNMGTWNAYNNRYWPHELLIDIDGYIVHDHIGEGDYDVTEKAIQSALAERNTVLGLTSAVPSGIVNPTDAISMDPRGVQSPETYFGAARNEFFANGDSQVVGTQQLVIPGNIEANPALSSLYLEGSWNFKPEWAETVSKQAKIIYRYNAKNVYFVAAASSSAPAGVIVDIKRDGVFVKKMTIQQNKLYTLIEGSDYGAHALEIDVEGAGLEAFTFTFG